MPTQIKMPALSPTMESGKLARWLVKAGDTVASGDILAEIETDKATMEFEAVDEGVVASIDVAEGTEGVKVGAVIATITGEDETDAPAAKPAAKAEAAPVRAEPAKAEVAKPVEAPQAAAPAAAAPPATPAVAKRASDDRIIASPLARRLAAESGVDLAQVSGSGPNGRIVKADIDSAGGTASKAATAPAPAAAAPTPVAPTAGPVSGPIVVPDYGIPFVDEKLSGMRKTIARRLTESKQQVPHIYLTVDVRLDALLKLRGELNAALAARKVKLSVNDMIIKALGVALTQVPACNVAFAGEMMRQYSRADISVAVSIPGGLITPIITDAGAKSLSTISAEMTALAAKARDGKLQPGEYQGGTASLSNMGMMRIKQFDAVINPPQGMIMAIGAGEKRPWVMADETLGIATIMSATGSFDHRAVDGADAATLMNAFRDLIETPLGLIA